MRDILYLIILFLGVGIVRLCYGMTSNNSEYTVLVLLEALPDVKEDFSAVLETFEAFVDSFSRISSAFSGGNIFDMVGSFFSALASFLRIPVAMSKSLIFLLRDTLKFFETVFMLMFGPVQSPILPYE